MSNAKIYTGIEAERRLDKLQLPQELLLGALTSGGQAWNACTKFDPKFMAGISLYSRIVRTLRQELTAQDWRIEDSRNIPVVVRGDGDVKVLVSRGNSQVGKSKGDPETFREHGKAMSEELAGQEEDTEWQISEVSEFFKKNYAAGSKASTVQIWVLLYYRNSNTTSPKPLTKLRGELSRPHRMTGTKSRLTSWQERILLPEISLVGQLAVRRPTRLRSPLQLLVLLLTVDWWR